MIPLHFWGKRRAAKILSAVLVFAICLSSLTPVFAEEQPVTSSKTTEEQINIEAQTESNIQNQSTEEELTTQELTEDEPLPPESMSSMSSSGDPNGTGDENVATNLFKLEPDSIGGGLVYDFKIQVPPGRNGVAPDLRLQYNSQQGEDISYLGYGWSLNIPYIERLNRKGTDQLYNGDNLFYSSLDGEIASTTQSTSTPIIYGAKVEKGDFRKYEFRNGNSWVVTDKNGFRYTFGTSSLSQIASSTQIYRWMLEEVRDANNNFVRYEYVKDTGQIYPSKIVYTGNGVTDGVFEVVFVREARSDIATSSKPGFVIADKYRIQQIQTKVNGTWVKKYDLTYRAGDNGRRSLLSSITENGLDEASSTLALPAHLFTYQASSTTWVSTSTWLLPSEINWNSKLADVNGDGMVDLVRSLPATDPTTYINNGAGWTRNDAWGPPILLDADDASQLVDINGDGYADIIRALSTEGRTYTYLNNATTTGWTLQATSSWNFPLYLTIGTTTDTGVRIADVNGDGLPDVVRAKSGSPEIKEVYINNGSNWVLNASWTVPTVFENASTTRGTFFADVNGDGLQDIVEAYNNGSDQKHTYLNTGLGWEESSVWALPELLYATRLIDLNGDGLLDVVRADALNSIYRAYINNGAGWTLDSGWSIPQPIISSIGGDNGVRFVDIDGDGFTDELMKNGITTTSHLSGTRLADALSRATNDKGGSTSATYRATPQYKNGTTNLNAGLSITLQTVRSLTFSPLVGTSTIQTFSYEGGQYYYNGPFDRHITGFATTTKTNDLGHSVRTFFHQGTTTTSSIGEYDDHISKIGFPFRIEKRDESGNILAKSINKWERTSLGNGRNFVKLTQGIDFELNGDSTHRDKAQTSVYDDATGNVTEVADWGEVTGTDSGTFTDVGSDKASTTITYAASSTGYLYAPSQRTTFNQSLATTSSSKFSYDSQVLGITTAGNLTKQENWISGTTYASSTKTYNSYGLVTQEKDPRSNATTYTYDPFNIYPSTSTNALSQISGYLYDYSVGKVKQTIDANSFVYQTVFDALDRVSTEKQPDLTTPTTLVTKAAYTYTTSTTSPTILQKTSYLTSASSTDIYSYLDGFGRLVQTRKSTEATTTFSTIDRGYNSLGLLAHESLPYFASSTVYESNFPQTSHPGVSASSTLSNGLIAYWAFNEPSGTASDSTGNGKTLTNNNSTPFVSALQANGTDLERGNNQYFSLTSGTDFNIPTSTINCWINIESNPLVLYIISTGVNHFRHGFDFRVNEANKLHAAFGDGTYEVTGASTLALSTWYMATYEWNPSRKEIFLNSISEASNESDETIIDPGVALNLGRGLSNTTQYFDGVIDECSVWNRNLTQYELTALYNAGAGMPYASTSTTAANPYLYTTHTYDALGREVALATNVGTTTNSYDDWHTVTTDPRGKRKDFYKDSRANLSQVIEHDSTSHATTTYGYDINKNLTLITDASNNTRAFTYDGLNRRLTAEDLHTSADGMFGTSTYAYDLAGNLTQQVDPKGQTVNFTYDALNRPQTEDYTGSAGTEVQYAYDSCANGIGRLCAATSTDAATAYTYNALGQTSRELKTIDSTQYQTFFDYDRLGNIASTTYPNGSQTINIYNAAGLLERIDNRQAGGALTNIVVNFDYGPHEKVTTQQNGNGSFTYKTYDAAALYRLINLRTVTAPITTLGSGGVSASSTLANGLLSYWTFDEPSGAAADSTANGKTLTNNNTVAFGSAQIGNGADLEASSAQYFSRANGGYYNVTSGTINLWTKLESSAIIDGNPEFIGYANPTGGLFFGYRVHNSMTLDAYFNSDPGVVTGATSLSTGVWYMVTFTWDTSRKELFVNATTDGANETDETLGAGETTISVGRNQRFGINHVDGFMDEFGFWNRVLSPYEISALYNSGSGMGYSGNTTAATTTIQDVSYTYDANSNITQISDMGSTTASRIVLYAYDDLNRLTSASTTAASSTPFRQTFSYDMLGNLTGMKLNSNATTTYTYAGTGYANPHAATTIDGVAYSYDANGDLASAGTKQFTWDYRDRLTRFATSTATSTYAYDHTVQRVRQSIVGSATTTYANKYFDRAASSSQATSTTYIWAGDTLIATVSGNGSATSTSYMHPDHLGSTNVVTNASGTVLTAKDYMPYGNSRTTSGASSLARGYIGEFQDSDSMSYLNARYYEGSRGQFLSQDPIFWEIGKAPNGQSVLSNPQSMNSYAYAGANPIINKDPSGKFWWKEFYTDWAGYDVTCVCRDNGIILKLGEVAGGRSAALSAIASNAGNIDAASQQTGMSPELIKAIIYEEQSHQFPPFGLETIIENIAPGLVTGGIGVMQVSSKTSGQSNKSLLDPRININTGASVLMNIQNQGYSTNSDLAARYNNQAGGAHADRYGARVNSYIGSDTYISVLSSLVSQLSSLVSQLTAAMSSSKSR